MQLALVACYINLIAASSDYLAWKGHGPVVRDAWGVGTPIVRMVSQAGDGVVGDGYCGERKRPSCAC